MYCALLTHRPDDGVKKTLRNVVKLSPDYTAQYPRRRSHFNSRRRENTKSQQEILFSEGLPRGGESMPTWFKCFSTH